MRQAKASALPIYNHQNDKQHSMAYLYIMTQPTKYTYTYEQNKYSPHSLLMCITDYITWKYIHMCKLVSYCQFQSKSWEEMCDSHGGGGLVASLYTPMLAESNVEALVNKRLIGVVVVG